jgi:hypothetical protein
VKRKVGERNLIQTNFSNITDKYETEIKEGSVENKEKNGTENKGIGE